MMANSEDNAELRARVMASLKKFEKIPENVATPQSQPTNSASSEPVRPATGSMQGSGGFQNGFRKRRYRVASNDYSYGYGASNYGQQMMPNGYNQASYYPQYSPYMTQSGQSSYGYPSMMGVPQPYMMPQQSYIPTMGMEGFAPPPMYGQHYPSGPFYRFRKRRPLPVKKSKSSSRNSDSEYSTDYDDEDGGSRSQRVSKAANLSSKLHLRKPGNKPRLVDEHIDLTMEDEIKCKPEDYLHEDVIEPHIVDAFPMPIAELPPVSVPPIITGLELSSNNPSSTRYKLLSAEYEKQSSHLLEAQENLQRLTSAIRIQQIRLNENSEIANAHLAKIERLQDELAKEHRMHEIRLNESRQIQKTIDGLNEQYATTERFVNSLNENVMKKKVFMSQMEVQEHKVASGTADSTTIEKVSEPEKTVEPTAAPAPLGSDLVKKFSNTKSDYHLKLVEAYHKVLENKLLLFKARKSRLSPFAVDTFVLHLVKMFTSKNENTSIEIAPSIETFDVAISDSKLNQVFILSSFNGLADINESFGIIDKDDDIKLEEHLVELIFYYYLLNNSTITPIEQMLQSISSSNGTFLVLDAVEKFSKLLSNSEFHPHIFKEKPKYSFSPFFQSSFTFSEESIKESLVNLMPRFFSIRVAMYLGSPRGIDNSAFMEEENEFEDLLESDPQNIENWLNYALAVLPTDMTLDNIWAFPKDSFEKCLSILSRAIEIKNDSDELWVCYLDLFCYQTECNAEELAEMFSFALQYFSTPSIISLMHISNLHDLNAKIVLAKNFLKSSWDRIDLESTARAIFCLISLYQNAKYEDCCKSLIFGLFFNDFTDIHQLLQYDDVFFTLPESFQHKSFVNTFFVQTDAALKMKTLLWNCAIHFLLHGCLPVGLFLDYPYEYFADLSFEFILKMDTSKAGSETGQILRQSQYALEYLLQESELNILLKANLASLSGTPSSLDSSEGLVLNHTAPNNPVDFFNQEYVLFIKHFIPTYDAQSTNFASINRTIQRSLGIFNDFERITTSLPLQKKEPLPWINYFIFLVKNKTSPKDMEKFFEDALVHVEGQLRIFIWREFICWLFLTQSTSRIQETLERFLDDVLVDTEFHPSMRVATNSCLVGVLMGNVLSRIGSAIDRNKKIQIVHSIPAELLPVQLFLDLDPSFAMLALLSRASEIPTCGLLIEELRLFLTKISHLDSSIDVNSCWSAICRALNPPNSFIFTTSDNLSLPSAPLEDQDVNITIFPPVTDFDDGFNEESEDAVTSELSH